MHTTQGTQVLDARRGTKVNNGSGLGGSPVATPDTVISASQSNSSLSSPTPSESGDPSNSGENVIPNLLNTIHDIKSYLETNMETNIDSKSNSNSQSLFSRFRSSGAEASESREFAKFKRKLQQQTDEFNLLQCTDDEKTDEFNKQKNAIYANLKSTINFLTKDKEGWENLKAKCGALSELISTFKSKYFPILVESREKTTTVAQRPDPPRLVSSGRSPKRGFVDTITSSIAGASITSAFESVLALPAFETLLLGPIPENETRIMIRCIDGILTLEKNDYSASNNKEIEKYLKTFSNILKSLGKRSVERSQIDKLAELIGRYKLPDSNGVFGRNKGDALEILNEIKKALMGNLLAGRVNCIVQDVESSVENVQRILDDYLHTFLGKDAITVNNIASCLREILEGIDLNLEHDVIIANLRKLTEEFNLLENPNAEKYELFDDDKCKILRFLGSVIAFSYDSSHQELKHICSQCLFAINRFKEEYLPDRIEKEFEYLNQGFADIQKDLLDKIASLEGEFLKAIKDLREMVIDVLSSAKKTFVQFQTRTTELMGGYPAIDGLKACIQSFYADGKYDKSSLEAFTAVLGRNIRLFELFESNVKSDKETLERYASEHRKRSAALNDGQAYAGTAFQESLLSQFGKVKGDLTELNELVKRGSQGGIGNLDEEIKHCILKCNTSLLALERMLPDRLPIIDGTIVGIKEELLDATTAGLRAIKERIEGVTEDASNITGKVSAIFSKKVFFGLLIFSGIFTSIIGYSIFPSIDSTNVGIKQFGSILLLWCGVGLLLASSSQIDSRHFYKTDGDAEGRNAQYGKAHAIFIGVVPGAFFASAAVFLCLRIAEIQPLDLSPKFSNELLLIAGGCVSLVAACIMLALMGTFKSPSSNIQSTEASGPVEANRVDSQTHTVR